MPRVAAVLTFEGTSRDYLISRWPVWVAVSGGFPQRAELLAALLIEEPTEGQERMEEYNHNHAGLRCSARGRCVHTAWAGEFAGFLTASEAARALVSSLRSVPSAYRLWLRGDSGFFRALSLSRWGRGRSLSAAQRAMFVRAASLGLAFVQANRPT